MLDANEINELIKKFKSDLIEHNETYVVQKHILTGTPVVMTPEAYFEIRHNAARQFGISPSEILIVGSCRTGFSLKDDKVYMPAGIESDIDVTVVSNYLFDLHWEQTFLIAKSDTAFRKSNLYKKFSTDLANGWIMPREVPPSNNYTLSREWVEYFNKLSNLRLHGLGSRSISARLYKSWSRLQTYQEILVRRRRNEIVRNKT
jgi:hypothetical protein